MKKALILLALAALILTLHIPVYAHPGRTDSKGGHTDHSTGDYHYHHGFSAHSHYDMDGDGVVDCPYDFEDRTNHSSYSANQSTSFISSTVTEDVQDANSKGVFMDNFWKYLLASAVGFVVGYLIKGRSASKRIAQLESQHTYTVQKLTAKIDILRAWIKNSVLQRQRISKKTVEKERAASMETFPPEVLVNFRDPDPFSLFYDFRNNDDHFALPPGVYIEDGAFLSLGSKSKEYPYGNYTVFINPGSDVYHTIPYCRGHHVFHKANILNVMETKRPCSHCGRNMPQSKKIPTWYRNFKNTTSELGIEW